MRKLSKVPQSAFEAAQSSDRQRVINAYEKEVLRINWPEAKAIKNWAQKQGWPTPLLNFQKQFLKKMLESDANFTLVLQESGIQISIPKAQHEISNVTLQKWDALYEEREDLGTLGKRPTGWGQLVESLREVRRMIEVGVEVVIEGKRINRVGSFLSWVHQRYHMLEDGFDSWVGDDQS